MKILVMGGNRYFGKQLVERLVREGESVTVANRTGFRGLQAENLRSVSADRLQADDLKRLAQLEEWDVVYDQICYAPDEAQMAIAAFEGRVGRWVHTSTQSIYNTYDRQSEKAFDPYHYPIKMGSRTDYPYGEAKRLSEAVLFQRAKFPVVAMRIPIVFGADDYTGRLEFHIQRSSAESELVCGSLTSRTSVIHSRDAAAFLAWLRTQSFTGPVNAASPESISLLDLLDWIAKANGERRPQVVAQGAESNQSPMFSEISHFLDVSLAQSLGYRFESLESWLPELIQQKV
jgi:nucleoside-diphosphate-sugar epimerase